MAGFNFADAFIPADLPSRRRIDENILEFYPSVVGKENVIAGTDCGFSQFWDSIRVHPSVQWAKLKSLVDGAALASTELWRTRATAAVGV